MSVIEGLHNNFALFDVLIQNILLNFLSLFQIEGL